MMEQRVVVPEQLDTLPVDDPGAMHARTDLRRIHDVMGSRAIIQQALQEMPAPHGRSPRLRVLELGAGDGTLMLGVAHALSPRWPPVELTLLDRQALTSPATLTRYARLGWTATAHTADVFDWADHMASLTRRQSPRWDLIVANLFLHHFSNAQLVQLMGAIASRTPLFFACEPRRAPVALAGSHLVAVLGANAITRGDAVLSVRAGFRDQELTGLWPNAAGRWQTTEYAAGLFSHCFRAERKGTH